MTSKSSLFSKLLGSGTSGTIPQTSISSDVSFGVSTYDNISTLPLSGNNVGDQAFVDSDNRLYIWNGAGWYNIALINTSPSITGGYNSNYQFEINGTPIVITLVGSDPEGIPLTWSYEVTSGSLTNGGGTTATVSNVDNVFTITPSTNEAYSGTFELTFKASDGVNIGTAVSSFTLAFYIINSNYTTLLAKATTDTDNSTFTDTSTNNFTVTRTGTTLTQGTFSPGSRNPGEWSAKFDGSGDYLTFSDAVTVIGNSDFTIELWVYPTDTGPIFSNATASTDPAYIYLSTSSLRLRSADGDQFVLESSVPLNVWSHIAITRSGNTYTYWLNGVSQASGNSTKPITARTMQIGAFLFTNYVGYYSGYISNFRIVKGTAIYTTTFTPDKNTPLTKIANTSFLSCQDNYFKDNSDNNFAITTVGGTAASPFSMVEKEAVYNPLQNGTSAYFNASDYLAIANNAALYFGSGEYTVEAWVYPTASGTRWIGGIWSYSTPSAQAWGIYITGGKYRFTIDPADTIINTSTSDVKYNQWTHVACTRSGDTFRMFINGILESEATSAGYVMQNGTSPVYIGTTQSAPGGVQYAGYIKDFHVMKGAAKYTTNFTPSTDKVTATANTSLLLNFDNVNIYDQTGSSDLTLYGNTTHSNTQTKNASYSMYFDGTGDYIGNLNTYSVTGDFTVELWMYKIGAWAGNEIITYGSSDGTMQIGRHGSVSKFGMASSNVSWIIESSTMPLTDQWVHIAFSRSGSTVNMFYDGILILSTTSTATLLTPEFICYSGDYFTGYIEDLRITKGLARYTANFTPPTAELLG